MTTQQQPKENTMTTATTLYLNNDARLGNRAIGTEAEIAPMLPAGADLLDYDVFEFTTLAQLLAHLMDGSIRVTTVELACREFLGMVGSELVTRIS